MDYKILEKNSGSILTLSEITQHLRVYDEYDEGYLWQLYEAAYDSAEAYMNRVILKSKVIIETDDLTAKLPQGIAEGVESITYMDSEENRVDLLDYTFNEITNKVEVRRPARLVLCSSKASKYQITFTTGWDESEVPATIKQALLLLIGSLYEMREDTVIGQGVTVNKVPNTHKALLSKYKIRRLG